MLGFEATSNFDSGHEDMIGMQASRLGQYLSAGAVVLSLLFVGLEIRNNTIATRGTAMQAISDANTAFRRELALSPDFSSLVIRVFSGEDRAEFNPAERMRLDLMLASFAGNLENVYLQYNEGLVPDSIFDSYGWNDNISRTPYFADWWADNSNIFSVDFKAFYEQRRQIGPTRQ